MQAVPALKGPMSVAKVPLTLQSLSGKEEEQHQAPQNLASHAVRTTRGKPAQTRDCHHRREVNFQRQLLQFSDHRILKVLQQGFVHVKALEETQGQNGTEARRGQPSQRRTIRGS